MNRFFTLIVGLVLLCPATRAQYVQNFESAGVLGTNCLDQTQFVFTNGSDVQVIHGLGSAYTNPPTSATETRSLTTPFLDITADPLTISFYYQLSNKLNGNATRVIELGLVDRYGVFTSLDIISMDKTSATTAQYYEQTFTGIVPGVQRAAFRITGETGDGNSRMIYDDLSVSASPHYGPVVNCNTAPQAVNDNYFSPTIVPVSGNVLTDGADWDANGEALTAVMVNAPADSLGTITFNPDGTFTFTPAAGYRGGLVTFTYRVSDNGYPSATSAVATVTISYTISTLPVQLTGFGGQLVGGYAELSWSVASNENAGSFVVERSSDGRNFTRAGVVPTSGRSGGEVYRFTDIVTVRTRTIYRLRMRDRQGKETYSRAVLLQAGALSTPAINVYNTPAQPGVFFSYTATRDANVSVRVYNMGGQQVFMHNRQVKCGVNQLTVDSPLSCGQVYILEVMSNSERSVVKFRK